MAKLYAKDIPRNGASVRVTVNGQRFEVRRIPQAYNKRRFEYAARRLPALNDFSGWWFRWSWALMEADLQLMAKDGPTTQPEDLQ